MKSVLYESRSLINGVKSLLYDAKSLFFMERSHLCVKRGHFSCGAIKFLGGYEVTWSNLTRGAGVTEYFFKLVSNSFLYLMNAATILVSIRRICFIMFTQFFSVSECLCFCVTVCRRVKDRLLKRQPDH